MPLPYFEAVNVALSPQLEKFVTDQVASGRFANATEVVTRALKTLEGDPLQTAPVFPPGSLADIFTPEANAAETKKATASALEVEGW